jgi:hypothetical protein
MSKFALFIMICSSVQNVCTEPHSNYVKYEDFHSCISSGATNVIDIINNFDKNQFNKDKVVIRFYCEEVNEDSTNNTTVQNISIS